MARLSAIHGIAPDLKRRLKRAGIKTTDQLWRELGQNLDSGLTKLGFKLGVTTQQAQLLIFSVLLERAMPFPLRRPRRMVSAFGLLTALVAGVVWTAAIGGWPGLGKDSASSVVVVGPEGGVPALRVLTSADLSVSRLHPVHGTFARAEDLVGRVTLKPLKPGQMILNEDVGPRDMTHVTLTGRRVLAVPLASESFGSHIEPGAEVSLIFSANPMRWRSECKTTEIAAIVLKATAAKEGRVDLLIAVEATDIDRIAPLLGCSQVFASVSVP